MKPLIMAGVSLVVLALVAYTTGIAMEQRRRRITGAVLAALVVGVLLDLGATVCMVLGTRRSPLTPHGLLGLSAILVMVGFVVAAAGHRRRKGEAEVPSPLHLFARLAYAFWVIAFVSGAAQVAVQRAARPAALPPF